MKVLVADDDVTSRKMLAAIVQKGGYDVVEATDGNKAWQYLRASDGPRLALIDWMMPGLNGIEICRKFQELASHTPPYIILITSRDKNEDIVKGLNSGASDYLVKPFDTSELRARLEVGHRVVQLQAELAAARDAFEFEATHDSLTGILDRATIISELENELSRAESRRRAMGIALGDLDHFKHVNDTHGHQIGDQVLCGFVKRVESAVRGTDVFGRYGGEEFLIIAPGASECNHNRLWDRIRTSVCDVPIETGAGKIGITVSLGVAFVPPYISKEELLGAADEALYAAKDAGRNCVMLASECQQDAV